MGEIMRLIFISLIFLFSTVSHACIQGIFQAKAQGLQQQLQAETQATNQIIKLADDRFKAIKDTRNNLLKAWVKYIETKNKEERKIANEQHDIADKESEFRKGIRDLKKECRDRAQQTQTAADAEVTTNPVTNNPTRLRGSYRRQKYEYNRGYKICMRDPAIVEAITDLHKDLAKDIRRIKKVKEDSIAAIQVLHQTTSAVQQNHLLNRKEALAHLDYKEGIIRQMQARAISVTRQVASLNQTGAALQCIMQSVQGASGGSQSSN